MKLPSYNEARKREKRVFDIESFELKEEYKNIGNGKTYYVKTYGCQMNEHDSENIRAMLEQLGFKKSEKLENANLIILNTCSIRENAHNKAFGMMGRIKHLKEEGKDILLGVCGCMAQEEGVVNEIITKHKHVDFVFGTHNLYDLPEVVFNSYNSKKQEINVLNKEEVIMEEIPVKRDSKFKAFVNIIYGCDKFCTYCIVPYTRGSQRSRRHQDILKEVNELVKDGYKEVTLLGQNVNAYGKDLDDNYYMEDLLEDVAKTGIPRVRFMTSHPWDFTDKMIDVISKYDNIMPSIHLPVQSGSSKVLKTMGRRYTKEEYLTLFKKIKEKIKNVTISTDIIVGFPTETEEDFNETLDLALECKYDNAFSFIFSKRENTPACKLEDLSTEKEKSDRLHKLNDILNKYFLESNKNMVGKKVKVLVEGLNESKNGVYGYTENNKLINFNGDEEIIGEIVEVEVCDAKTWSLDGKLCIYQR